MKKYIFLLLMGIFLSTHFFSYSQNQSGNSLLVYATDNLFFPKILESLKSLRLEGGEGEALFSEVLSINQYLAQFEDAEKIFLANGKIGGETFVQNDTRVPLNKALGKFLQGFDKYIRINVNNMDPIIEFQFYVSDSVVQDIRPLLMVPGASNYFSRIIDISEPDLEYQISTMIRSIFPNSDSPPTIRFNAIVNGKKVLKVHNNLYVMTGDSVWISSANSTDKESKAETLLSRWALTHYDPASNREKILKTEESSSFGFSLETPGTFTINLELYDGVHILNEAVKVNVFHNLEFLFHTRFFFGSGLRADWTLNSEEDYYRHFNRLDSILALKIQVPGNLHRSILIPEIGGDIFLKSWLSQEINIYDDRQITFFHKHQHLKKEKELVIGLSLYTDSISELVPSISPAPISKEDSRMRRYSPSRDGMARPVQWGFDSTDLSFYSYNTNPQFIEYQRGNQNSFNDTLLAWYPKVNYYNIVLSPPITPLVSSIYKIPISQEVKYLLSVTDSTGANVSSPVRIVSYKKTNLPPAKVGLSISSWSGILEGKNSFLKGNTTQLGMQVKFHLLTWLELEMGFGLGFLGNLSSLGAHANINPSFITFQAFARNFRGNDGNNVFYAGLDIVKFASKIRGSKWGILRRPTLRMTPILDTGVSFSKFRGINRMGLKTNFGIQVDWNFYNITFKHSFGING